MACNEDITSVQKRRANHSKHQLGERGGRLEVSIDFSIDIGKYTFLTKNNSIILGKKLYFWVRYHWVIRSKNMPNTLDNWNLFDGACF